MSNWRGPKLDSRVECKKLKEDRQTAFVKDYSFAADLIEEARDLLLQNAKDDRLQLFSDDNLIKAICKIIRAAVLLTDMRLMVYPDVVKILFMLPRCELSTHCPLDALEEGHPSLPNMTLQVFLVMMYYALQFNFTKGSMGASRRIIHELQSQLNGDLVDFSEMENFREVYSNLTEQDIRFAVACLGIKINRGLYRYPQHSVDSPGEQPLSQGKTLENCKYFTTIQKQLRPESPTASWNLAWCAKEAEEIRDMHDYYQECVVQADRAEHDLYRVTARIELAGSLVFGAPAYPEPSKVKREVLVEMKHEFEQLMNDLADWGMDEIAYGESGMSSVVSKFLQQRKKTDQFGNVPTYKWEGQKDDGQDPNAALCANCHLALTDIMRCARCKVTNYCSKDCQGKQDVVVSPFPLQT
jgi:hypothetical protein